ncbi:MAG: hypothetical protein EOO40_02445 [Deltaproteobacteria bacterium]|nr:MAG: hypothetical protein EOO40_02445 [Deltaproteobacteria bacterium]
MTQAPNAPKVPQTTSPQKNRERGSETTDVGNVPDSGSQERERAKAAMAQSKANRKTHINEGGRSHESDDRGNAPEATDHLPTSEATPHSDER